MNTFPSKQRGATLVIGMIMLILVTLFVIAAINMSTINLRVMANEQARNESIAAAQQAIEQIVSTDFTKAPAAKTISVDINGDGTADYEAAVPAPSCLNSVPIKLVELNIVDPNDQPCFGSGASSAPGVVGGGGTGDSLCSNTQWDVSASVTDATAGTTGAALTLHQGVGKRVATGDATC